MATRSPALPGSALGRSPVDARTTFLSDGDRSVSNLPLWLVMSYLVTVFALFLIWPVNWPIYTDAAWVRLTVYVALCFLVIFVSFRRGSRPRPFVREPFRGHRNLILAGTIAAVVLLLPSTYLYTGRWPWQVLEALQDQGEAYKALQSQLVETTGQRAPIALARALLAPATFAVLPLGILYWASLSWLLRGAVIVSALTALNFSILRGTDKEIADLFVISGSALLILIARTGGRQSVVVSLFKRYWKALVGIVLFVAIAASLYSDRKSARIGQVESRTVVCANNTQVCASLDEPIIAWMPQQQRFSTSIFLISATQGFYGLGLAMEKDFQPTFGAGHSAASLAIYELITGDPTLKLRTYTYRNGEEGWSDEYFWSSLITWIANDVGFPGALLALGLIGYIWGAAWRDSTVGGSDAAAVVFCLLMVVLVYLPANNQVFNSYDGYTVFGFWLFAWANSRKYLARSAQSRA